jgi:DNA-binding MarR family transcriptional regulator
MNQVEQLDAAISTLLRVLIIDERRLSSAVGTMPFNLVDLETLSFLDQQPGCSAKTVAAHLGIRPTTMQSVLDRLEKRALVNRDKTATKGRAVALTLTKQGLNLRKKIRQQNIRNCGQMLDCLTADARAPFVRNMTRIAAQFSE